VAPLLLLFAGALLCHDSLWASRPAPDRLTGFYLVIALGGVLGGVAVSWIAPLVFDDYYELELSVLVLYALLMALARGFSRVQRQALFLGMGIVVPLLSAALIMRAGGETRQGVIVQRMRGFLGPLRVTQLPEGRVLTHGRIRHGMQLSAAGMRDQPTMYFGPGTALAQVMLQHHAQRPRRIAVLGLGVGTIAAYGKAGDLLRFYELDANVVTLARRDFTFLRDSRARVEMVLGDGRLSLAHERAQGFDVLALDAFSSDSVPVHLLTREAFGTYAKHLAADGVLLANVSNRHLQVERVVRASAKAAGLACSIVETLADPEHFVSRVRWAVMARDPHQLARLLQGAPLFSERGPDVLWTDARASLWSIWR
jgi:hypothetical protein